MDKELSEISDILLPGLLTHGLKIILIAAGSWIFYRIAKRIIINAVRVTVVRDKKMSEAEELKREDTLRRIFNGAVKIAVLTISLLMILRETGIDIGPILAGAGIVGLALGFGGQYLIRDIISGLFIILENQYRIGDVVELNSTGGLVEDISLRMTTLRNLDGTVHHIPHGEIKIVSNLSKDFARMNLDLGVSYSSDLEHVINVINRTGEELAADPQFRDSIVSPPRFLRVNDFADSAIVVKVLGDTLPLKQWEITGEFRKRIKIAFDREGIEIPFPQRVIHHMES